MVQLYLFAASGDFNTLMFWVNGYVELRMASKKYETNVFPDPCAYFQHSLPQQLVHSWGSEPSSVLLSSSGSSTSESPGRSVTGFHPCQIRRFLPAQAHLLLLVLLKIWGHPIDKIRDGKTWEDHDGFVPDHKRGYDRQEEGDFKGVDVLGIHGVMKGQGVVVVVQQDTQPPQLQAGLHQHLLPIVPNHKVVVAAGEYPWRRVLAVPFIFCCWLISHAYCVPVRKKRFEVGKVTECLQYTHDMRHSFVWQQWFKSPQTTCVQIHRWVSYHVDAPSNTSQ